MLPKKIKTELRMKLRPIIYDSPSYEDKNYYQLGFKAGYRAAMHHKSEALIRVYQTQPVVNAKDYNEEVEFIFNKVIEITQVSQRELLSDTRVWKVSRARSIIMIALRELLSISYPAIGRICGDKDHSTVIHHCRMKIHKTRFWEEGSTSWEIYDAVISAYHDKFQVKNA